MSVIKWCRKYKGEEAVFRERLYELILAYPETTLQRSTSEAFDQLCESTESLTSWIELSRRDQDGNLVAFAILADDDDPHVGPCLSVQWRIEFADAPKGTTLALQRDIRWCAKMLGHRVIAFTKRLSMGRFEIIFKQLK